MAYYIVNLRKCPCGKPATQEVQGPGNASYGKFCEACAKAHLARLEESGEFSRAKMERP